MDLMRSVEGNFPNDDFLDQLRKANRERQRHWKGAEFARDPLFRAVEFAEEAGEVLGAIKKYYRAQNGIAGSGATLDDIKNEMGDALITLDLLAAEYDIDLAQVTKDKFNQTSIKVSIPVLFDKDC